MKACACAATFLYQLARLGALGGAALALVASSESGERGGGECPTGESCSPGTPTGLLFEGAPLGTWPALTAHTIAAGGRQTFRLTYPETQAAFDLPFTAKVTGAGRQVVAAGDDRAVVSAAGASTGYLRIVDPDGLLYDRLAIESAEIAEMRAAPAFATAYPSLDPPRWSAFAGGQATVTIVLEDAAGGTVVDEDLALRSPVAATRTSWDSYSLTTPVAGTIALEVDAGNVVARAVPVAVVNRFDELVVSAPADAGAGGNVTVCFPAWLRGPTAADDDDTLVVGVPRTYRVTGPATPLAWQPYASCLELRTEAAGTVTVDAVVGARTWTATIAVRGAAARDAGAFRDWLHAPSEGERASLSGR